jgi:hypothetical protein
MRVLVGADRFTYRGSDGDRTRLQDDPLGARRGEAGRAAREAGEIARGATT